VILAASNDEEAEADAFIVALGTSDDFFYPDDLEPFADLVDGPPSIVRLVRMAKGSTWSPPCAEGVDLIKRRRDWIVVRSPWAPDGL
jgi:hypothetical protein